MEILNCIVKLIKVMFEHSDELIISLFAAFLYDKVKNRSYGDKNDFKR